MASFGYRKVVKSVDNRCVKNTKRSESPVKWESQPVEVVIVGLLDLLKAGTYLKYYMDLLTFEHFEIR